MLKGHLNSVGLAAFSPDGSHLNTNAGQFQTSTLHIADVEAGLLPLEQRPRNQAIAF